MDWFLAVAALVTIGLLISIRRLLSVPSDAAERINAAAARLSATKTGIEQATSDASKIEPEGGS